MLSILNLFATDIETNLNKDRNIISLIGETHGDREDRKFKDFLFEEAKNENIILACEGGNFDEEFEVNTFGIDDSIIMELVSSLYYHCLLSFYKMTHDLDLHNDKNIYGLSKAKSFLTKHLLEFESCTYHFEQMCGTALDMFDFDSTKNEEILFKCKELVSYIEKEDQDLEDHYVIKNSSFETPFFLNLHPDIFQWLKMFKDSFDISAKKIITYPGAEISHTVSDASIMERFQNYLEENVEKMSKKERLDWFTRIFEDSKSMVKFVINQAIKLRDPIFLDNIIKGFEKSKSHAKPFYAVVGLEHIPYIYEGLKKQGYQVELNKKAQRKYDEFLSSTKSRKKEL